MAKYPILTKSEIDQRIENELGDLGSGFFADVKKVVFDGELACMKVGRDILDIDMFKKEAELMSYINGVGGCPRVLAAAVDYPCVVMTFVSGQTLEYLEDEGNLTPTQWINVFQAIARAVSEFHALSLIHCDLKCDNMLLDLSNIGEGKIIPHIIDVGLTHFDGCKFSVHTALHGVVVKPSLDVYSMGKMMKQTLITLQERGAVKMWPDLLTGLYEAMMDDDPSLVHPTLDDVMLELIIILGEVEDTTSGCHTSL